MKELSIVYLGGRQAGCIGLLTVLGARHTVRGVVAYDEEIARLAHALGLASVPSLHAAAVPSWLSEADLLVCVHGREVVPPELLRLPRCGGINVHPCFSRYKGAGPIERLLRDGITQASVGVHRMTERVDEGELLVELPVDVSGHTSPEAVYNALYPCYAVALLEALRRAPVSHANPLPR